MLAENGRADYENFENNAGVFDHQGGYDVSCHCRNYSPKSSARTINMGDYSSCDSCNHLRSDRKCEIAQQTLS